MLTIKQYKNIKLKRTIPLTNSHAHDSILKPYDNQAITPNQLRSGAGG